MPRARALGGSRSRPRTAGGASRSLLGAGGSRSLSPTVNRGEGARATGPIVMGSLPPPLDTSSGSGRWGRQQQQQEEEGRADDDDEDFTPGPGPGGFGGISSIGRQALSLNRSEVPVSFGRAIDVPSRRAEVPGPGTYEREGALGVQAESQFRSALRYSMRGREAFGSFDAKAAAALPGPGQYRMRAGTTSVVNLKERTPVTFSFRRGNGMRPLTASTAAGCGPGSYRAPRSLGKQALSQRRAETVHAFKRGPRFVRAARAGEDAGAEHFAKKEALGPQVTSQWRNEPAWGMGSQGRFKVRGEALRGGSPGPGRYSTPTALGKQQQSKTKNSSAAFMSGRTAFGNPFGKFGRR